MHQFRVTIKRLRAMLQLVRQKLPPEAYRELDQQLRDIGRVLAEQRMAAVLSDLKQRLHTRDTPGRKSQEQNTTALRSRLVGELAVHATALEERLVRLCSVNDLANGLTEIYRSAKHYYKHWRSNGNLAEAHSCRKHTKYLMYSLEYARPYIQAKKNKLCRRLSELEDLLGQLNDLAELAKLEPSNKIAKQSDELAVHALRKAKKIYTRSPSKFQQRLIGYV